MKRLVPAALLALVIIGVACAYTSAPEDVTATASPTVTASFVPTESSTALTSTPTAVTALVRWGGPGSAFRVLTPDPLTDPPRTPDRTLQLPEPVSPFSDPGRDPEHTLLYDFETEETEVLGPSHWGGGKFSSDGQYLVWLTQLGPERFSMHIRDTESGDEREVEVTRPIPTFIGEHEVLVGERLVDLETGDVRSLEALPDGAGFQYEAGLLVRSELLDKSGSDYTRRFVVSRSIESRPLLAVEGWLADVLDAETIAVMSAPVDGIASIHLLNVETQEVEFVATARQPFPGDLEGDGQHLAWIENACEVNQEETHTIGRVRAWNRETGEITEFEGATFVADVRDGRIAIGGFGPKAWYDIATGELLAAVPTSGELTGWSPDLRYASVGRLLGHGGRCP